jgi:Galactose oxidase, central domain/Kelch motif
MYRTVVAQGAPTTTRTTAARRRRPLLPPKISWTAITPTPDPDYGSPCTRSSHGLSYLPRLQRLVLVGGEHVARTPIEDEPYWFADRVEGEGGFGWRWRRWVPPTAGTTATVPPPRVAHAQAVYEDSVYIFGGRAGVAMDEKALKDMWKLDCSGPPGSETWSRVDDELANHSHDHHASDPPPEARSFHRMINIGSHLYVFGGCGASGRLADLHRFDILTSTWKNLGPSQLRGRGGTNLLPWGDGTLVGAIAGFAGEETVDGHMYDIATETWKAEGFHVTEMRPRSVCVSGSFPSLGYSIIFGGEVDPSDRGHEGAGSFANDVVVLEETDGSFVGSVLSPPPTATTTKESWPTARGWSDGCVAVAVEGEEQDGSTGSLYLFGGLAGDDANPVRLNDLWELKLEI